MWHSTGEWFFSNLMSFLYLFLTVMVLRFFNKNSRSNVGKFLLSVSVLWNKCKPPFVKYALTPRTAPASLQCTGLAWVHLEGSGRFWLRQPHGNTWGQISDTSPIGLRQHLHTKSVPGAAPAARVCSHSGSSWTVYPENTFLPLVRWCTFHWSSF